MRTLDRTITRARHGIAVVQLHEQLWRVTKPAGEVLGYIERVSSDRGPEPGSPVNPPAVRFRAKRFLARQKRFVVDGEFWSMDDAIECLRSI